MGDRLVLLAHAGLSENDCIRRPLLAVVIPEISPYTVMLGIDVPGAKRPRKGVLSIPGQSGAPQLRDLP